MNRYLIVIATALIVLSAVPGSAQEPADAEESSTHTLFPLHVEFEHDSVAYDLSLAGMTVRSKFFVKVYAIAHYMNADGFPDEDAALEAAVSDGYAKQITMVFVRGVEAEKIQNAYFEGFKKHATEEELAEIEPLMDQFVGYFLAKVEKGDRYVLRWLPGGTVLTTVQGKEMEPIENAAFARALWKIWLGRDSIVDRKKLVHMAVTGE